VALGSHGVYDMINARKKLGDEIVENYAVYNHDASRTRCGWAGLRQGSSSGSTGVQSCDLKIGIGCITPHVHVGFGGGAKLILPGVAGLETDQPVPQPALPGSDRVGLGNFENNIMRAECDAAGDAVGLNFKVDCLVNRRGQVTNLYAGDFRATHRAGGEGGEEHYGLPRATG